VARAQNLGRKETWKATATEKERDMYTKYFQKVEGFKSNALMQKMSASLQALLIGICIPSISKRWKDLRVSEVEIVSMHTSEACICGFITGEAYNVRVHISAVHVKGGKPHYTSY